MDTVPKHAVYSQAPIRDLLRNIYIYRKYVMFVYFINQFLQNDNESFIQKALQLLS